MHARLIAKTIAAAALIGITSASPTTARQISGISTYFNGSQWDEGCSPGGCVATFNLTASPDESFGMPGFNVSCAPIGGRDFANCKAVSPLEAGESVASRYIFLSDDEEETVKLYLEHIWLAPNGYYSYNASGSIALPAHGTTSFDAHITTWQIADQ
ncbi:hypothetical protein F5Y16DRAFT_380133 [Xylariaceae sp. FL0255]|nr:hypothetical protein F5Y16DRAFT_380133 [Xylariaceae sp. FL0255]